MFNTVSIVSLAYTVVNLLVSAVLTWIVARKVSRVEQLVVLWYIYDGLIHLTLVRGAVCGSCSKLQLQFGYSLSDHVQLYL